MDIVNDVLIPCLISTVGCCAFAIQFNLRRIHLVAAALGSFVSQAVFCLMTANGFSDIMSCFTAAAAAAAYSEIMARRAKAPVNMYLIIGIIPLVPGGKTFYAMLAIASGNSELFLDRAVAAFSDACAIAMGIFAVSSFVRLATEFYRKNEKKTTRAIKDLGGKGIKSIKKF